VVCVDASKGRSDRQGDYSAIVFMGIGRDRLLYVDALLERIPLDQVVRKTLVFCDERRPEYVGIEAEQFQELLVHEFRRQCGEGFTRRWPIYEMMTGGMPKIARIRRLSQYVINRELRFKADSPGCRLLVDQLMDFPDAEHDDGPDALEMCVRLPMELARRR
jgi:predicted phage terminase large subunit-like protein